MAPGSPATERRARKQRRAEIRERNKTLRTPAEQEAFKAERRTRQEEPRLSKRQRKADEPCASGNDSRTASSSTTVPDAATVVMDNDDSEGHTRTFGVMGGGAFREQPVMSAWHPFHNPRCA